MDPQERRPLPLFEYIALEEPGCCSLVVSLACYIVVCRGIREGEPIFQFLSELALCDDESVKNKRQRDQITNASLLRLLLSHLVIFTFRYAWMTRKMYLAHLQ
jgi:hypothetical protein